MKCKSQIYFDNNASTPVHPFINPTITFLNSTCYGNPSAVHKYGQQANKWIETSRNRVARSLNCNREEIYFCSSATEGNNTILKGTILEKHKEKNTIVISDIEHACVKKTCEFLTKYFNTTIKVLKVDKEGLINLDELEDLLKKDNSIALVSIIYANNEIGTIQPIKEAVKIAHRYNVCLHTDATQVVGKLPCDINELGVDILTASGHKFHGPKGIGFMYIKSTCVLNGNSDCSMCSIQSQNQGGGQEHDFRAGTENVPGIVSLGIALKYQIKHMKKHIEHTSFLRDYIESGLKEIFPNIKINGRINNRLPNTSNVCFPANIRHGNLSDFFIKHHICVSSGSACSKGKTSHVLEAIGLTKEEALRSVRISLSIYNTIDECDRFLKVVKKLA